MQYFNYNQEESTSSVQNISVLSGLSEDEWEMIIFNSHSIDFLAEEILLKEGELDSALYILVSGKVEVFGSDFLRGEKILAYIDSNSEHKLITLNINKLQLIRKKVFRAVVVVYIGCFSHKFTYIERYL